MSNIISELGVNWNGNISTAKKMITESKLAGADYIKLQLFDKSVIKNNIHQHALSTMILGENDLHELKSHADNVNIGFIVSCMYPGAFKLAEKVKPDFIKIRHTDRKYLALAKLAIDYCNRMNTKVLVSTDLFGDVSEVYTAHSQLCHFMYCIAKYPPTIADATLLMKYHSFLKAESWSGFSSHFRNVLIPALAVSLEIEFLEVHVSNFISDIDRNVSLTFGQLKTLCDFNKGIIS